MESGPLCEAVLVGGGLPSPLHPAAAPGCRRRGRWRARSRLGRFRFRLAQNSRHEDSENYRILFRSAHVDAPLHFQNSYCCVPPAPGPRPLRWGFEARDPPATCDTNEGQSRGEGHGALGNLHGPCIMRYQGWANGRGMGRGQGGGARSWSPAGGGSKGKGQSVKIPSVRAQSSRLKAQV